MHVGPCFAVTSCITALKVDLYESGPLNINVFEENKVLYLCIS